MRGSTLWRSLTCGTPSLPVQGVCYPAHVRTPYQWLRLGVGFLPPILVAFCQGVLVGGCRILSVYFETGAGKGLRYS